MCDALVAGDVEQVIAAMSDELKRNLGEVMALLPLPAAEANIASIDRGGSAYVIVLRIVGETDQAEVQTRWKDRDGVPRIVEVSNLSRSERPEMREAADDTAQSAADETPKPPG